MHNDPLDSIQNAGTDETEEGLNARCGHPTVRHRMSVCPDSVGTIDGHPRWKSRSRSRRGRVGRVGGRLPHKPDGLYTDIVQYAGEKGVDV